MRCVLHGCVVEFQVGVIQNVIDVVLLRCQFRAVFFVTDFQLIFIKKGETMSNHSTSSSSSAGWRYSEFCFEIPAAGLSNLVGAQVFINVAGRISESDQTACAVYFESTDPTYHIGSGNVGFEIRSPEAEGLIGVPLASVSLGASSLSFVISKASGGVKYPLRFNMYLWADPELGEIQLTGGISPGVNVLFGWEHNNTADTLNFNEWIAFGG